MLRGREATARVLLVVPVQVKAAFDRYGRSVSTLAPRSAIEIIGLPANILLVE